MCSPKTINSIGLVLDIIGAVFIFCESLKMGIRYDENGNSIPGAECGKSNLFYRNIGKIGLVLIGFGFLLQLISNYL